ncbi:MAG: hypothetical protein K0R51_1553 [Cytophagaceae bacterium]|jgi:hypothetical protein|nr:hypothetical protein [Cytophagaceae bacterium]
MNVRAVFCITAYTKNNALYYPNIIFENNFNKKLL